jgi:hypothetical protein
MPRFRLRRPSAPLLVALLALFVALGGPAEAKRLLVGSRDVRDHSLQVRDLSRKAARSLRRTPNGSINEAKLRNGAVTPGKLARGAVGSAAIADRSVGGGDVAQGAVGSFEVADGSLTGADVADGALDARDVGRFWGHFMIHVGPVGPDSCWRGDPVGLAPERSHADITGDMVLVTPGRDWPDTPAGGLSLTAHPSTTPGRFTLVACNPTSAVANGDFTFNYVVIDVP